MKAYVLHNINKFNLEEVSTPIPSENEVLVKVKAAGICGSDIPRVYKTGTYSYPLIPGHEFSGQVEAVGAGVDIFFECVGKNETVTQAVNSTISGGKIMLVGNPHSDMNLEKAVYWKILRHQLLVTGTWNSSFYFPEDEAVKVIQRKGLAVCAKELKKQWKL